MEGFDVYLEALLVLERAFELVIRCFEMSQAGLLLYRPCIRL
jgi:hypothetical protein